MQLFHKIVRGMANSVDPGHMAPSGEVQCGTALFAYASLSVSVVYEIVGLLP